MRARALLLAAGLAGAGLLALVGMTRWSDLHAGAAPQSAPFSAGMITRGAYLAKVGDCAACHSVAGAAPFSGGLKMLTPIGAIYTSNITPDVRNGIGAYSLADFDRALRFGVASGHTLYPAMPYSAYSITAPADVAALYAYFMRGVAPDPAPNRDSEIPFPLSMRWPLTLWRWAFAPEPRAFSASNDARLSRGAYLVEGLGHCGDCHTARGPALQVRALGASGGPAYLAGAMIDGWHAPSLRNGDRTSIGAWSEMEIAAFLRSGNNRHGIAFASMNEVIVNSTQFLTEDDALAVARFLKSLNDPAGGAYVYDATASLALRRGDAGARGAQLYLDNCAACHRPDGRGYEGVFPALAGNPVLTSAPHDSVVRIILQGMRTPRTAAAPAQFTMPAFAWRLSDQDVADVATFVRASWGNQAPAVDAKAIARLRPKDQPTPNH
ncbi:cytochrome c [Duganella aceris]|uniref:Cytochrome c n=1 Tax=Duganella aceris TaxID=2703883 RepID=A0ABX0FVC3_9BURK|nr:cytochrome c [Duganella aceris]NGZ88408.1 cytochrome c [Duganella aceris]